MNYTEFIDNAKAAFGENLGGRIPLRRSNGNGGYDYQLEFKPGADNAKMHGWEYCPEVPPEAIRPVVLEVTLPTDVAPESVVEIQVVQEPELVAQAIEPRKPGRPANPAPATK